MNEPITAKTRLAVVIGDPIEHSLSPALHNAAFAALGLDARFLALQVNPADLRTVVDALAAIGTIGASVTVPHKQAVIGLCNQLAPSAEASGAVNCLAFDGGKVIGHNTDASGFASSLTERFGEHPDGWKALILGGGGAARAVYTGLAPKESSVTKPLIIARSPERVDWAPAREWTSQSLADVLPTRNLIVDCTSAGLRASTERNLPAPINLDLCASGTVVATLIYHRDTLLLAEARARGLGVLDGMGMLVHQALGALDIWLGTQPPAEVLWDVMSKATKRRRRDSSKPPPQ